MRARENQTAFQLVLANVGKHVSLTSEEANLFTSLLTERTLPRKSVLVQEGLPCPSIYYIINGALRAFYRDQQANESVIMFGISDWWITDMYAFSTGQPALLWIDALEETTVLELRKEQLDRLYSEVPKFERFFRILLQNAYVREQLRMVQNLSMSAEERYHQFMTKYPAFARQLPLKQIASYLGITPEFLSVIRKRSPRENS